MRYLLGADHLGRDVLSRVIQGARISVQVVGIALVTGVLVGATMGLMAGYYGGWIDEIITRTIDMWNGLPFILIALVVSVILGTSTTVVMFLLALLAWTPFVRQVRADALVLRTRDYIASARIAGAGDFRIMLRHIFPGTVSTIMVVASLRVGGLILAEASLSFLGAGIPDPIPAWGKSVAEGRRYLATSWWISFFPGLAIFLVVMSLNFFGDWLRDRLDPRLRQLG
jgi:peptide/nickel transport system permease protein